MNSIAFTGPVDPPREAHVTVYNAILTYGGGVGEFHYGGAFGVDTWCASVATALYPEAAHILHVPLGCRWNERLERLYEFDEVIYVEGGYMKRNDSLVEAAGRLLAFPKTANEVLRSGTWATIRRARKAGVPVLMFPLS